MLSVVCAAFLLFQTADTFKFAKEQRVYVVAVETGSRNLNATSGNLQLERLAKNQFKKERSFHIATALREADFVFFVVLDANSANFDEIAMAVLPGEYERAGGNLDALRNAARWQADGHYKRGRHAALAAGTLGLSAIWDRSGVVQELVKQFHKETLGK